MDAGLLIAGRALIALLFLGGAVQKVLDPSQVSAMISGIGMPGWLVWPVAGFNLVAGLAVLMGWRLRDWALVLALYCLATSWFHWQLRADPWQITIMVKNWAIAGGLMVIAAQSRMPRGR